LFSYWKVLDILQIAWKIQIFPVRSLDSEEDMLGQACVLWQDVMIGAALLSGHLVLWCMGGPAPASSAELAVTLSPLTNTFALVW